MEADNGSPDNGSADNVSADIGNADSGIAVNWESSSWDADSWDTAVNGVPVHGNILNAQPSQPGAIGPYGYPLRFAVRELRALFASGLKIFADNDLAQPLRYIGEYEGGRRRILHTSAHKSDNSSPLVSIRENWPAGSPPPLRHVETFTITVYNRLGVPPSIYGMDHIRCRPTTYEFSLPFQDPVTGALSVRTFQWRRAPVCHETRGIIPQGKRPGPHTGQPRPPEDTSDWDRRRGFVLV
ncbi:uncharacterized protein B0T15DRAFT_534480 [Chaetomium strumarium]|uniref:Uncharacterized protein n=1 Tax=Chaetomium strumarium TaxID=1170767 RepID=A0AAJ0GTY7_9PEZI|nr:hypothetical protein B0T15DRAFT_534480 [Chaetomium strumarium]